MDSPESNDTGESGTGTGPQSSARSGAPIPDANWSRLRRRLALLTVFVVLVAGFLSWKSNPETLDPPTVNLNDSHDLVARTIQQARDSVIGQPQSATAWGRYGMCLYAHEFGSAARDCFEQAGTLDAKDYRWPYLQGISVTFTDPLQGLKFFEHSVRLRPDLVFVRMRATELSIDLNRLDQAQAHVDAVLAAEPNNARATLAAARLAERRGDPSGARKYALKSMQANPDMRGTYELLARICFQQQDGDGARKYLEQMQQATRTDDWPDPLLAQVMEMRRDLSWVIFQVQRQLDQGQTGEAIATLNQMTAQFPRSVELRIELIRALLSIEDFDEAARVLDKGLIVQPMSARLHRMQGLLHYQLGEKRQALKGFRRAVELKPDYSLGHYNLGRCLLELGDEDGARQALQTAAALQPDLPGVQDDLSRLELSE